MTSGESVSVIIPTYNRARLLLRAVCSVLVALAPGDELIVVDDGSSDETAALLEPYGDRIHYVRKRNGGVGSARNHGVRLAKNPLIAFNDSDDEWHADKLALQRAYMHARKDVVYTFTDLGVRREHGPTEVHGLRGWHLDPRPWDEILGPGAPYSEFAPLHASRGDFKVHVGDMRPAQLLGSHVATQTAMVRRSLAPEPPWFPEDVQLHEDTECFARLSRRGPAAYFDCDTVWQWGHSGPRLSRVESEEWLTIRLKVIERTFGDDHEFMASHAALYEQVLRATRIRLAREHLALGKADEARRDLRLVSGSPLGYRLLAALPSPVLSGIAQLRRALLHDGFSNA